MNIFKRISNIINSNVNSTLDKMENPEKLINLSISKLDNAKVDIKRSLANKKALLEKIARENIELEELAVRWMTRAKLAVEKGKDDLAKEALKEKANTSKKIEANISIKAETEALINLLLTQSETLEEKLKEMKEKQSSFVSRTKAAKQKIKSNDVINESNHYFELFEEIQNKIDKLEAQADIFTPSKQTSFETLEEEEEVEKMLRELKNNI